ncbi:MAG: S41 family peptidase [Planctomycetes bacterium]|nr:S41 family peptidase [Planctomycetota bacterium]
MLHTYSALVEVDALAKQKFVEPITGDLLVHGAIRGMMLQLDPYSGYIAPDQLAAFKRRNLGDYIGVGVELGMKNDRLCVVAPIEGSPAAAAGVVAGDTILSIEGQDLEGLSVFDVEELLVGEPGSTVRLRVEHAAGGEPEALTIIRGPVSLVTVRGFRRGADGRWNFLIDPAARVGYIRVSNFLDNTMRDFDAALEALETQRARGLILDLRFNPGGIMHQAIELVDRFVDDGIIVSTVNRRRAVSEYRATHRETLADIQLAVLVNAGSASAAEIVAGSLQAHSRAVVIGQRTFGKGSVQHLIPLTAHKAAVKLTTAYYRLPDGRIIHRTAKNAHTDAWGVTPDVEIRLEDDEVRAIQSSRRALDLAFGHTTLPHRPGDKAPPLQSASSAGSREILRDRQLLEALLRLRLELGIAATSRG